MLYRSSIGPCVLAAALLMASSAAFAFDETKYPDLKGQWRRAPNPYVGRVVGATYDPSKGWGPAQQPPLTPEYRARFEANLADQEAGGQGIGVTYTCVSPGMPRVTNGYGQTEFVVTPESTHILVENIHDSRRILTDGRDWPSQFLPGLLGYSIGRWIDTEGSGKYDVLEVETRGFIGPRAFDSSGIPLHDDNQTVVKERIYLDKNDPNTLRDEVTVIDNALTRPWTVIKSFRRDRDRQPLWVEYVCGENNGHIQIGSEGYMISGDGLLMPAKKGQQPPGSEIFQAVRREVAGLYPVLNLHSRQALEFASVVGHDRQPLGASMGAYPQVEWSNRCANALHMGTDLPKMRSGLCWKWKHVEARAK